MSQHVIYDENTERVVKLCKNERGAKISKGRGFKGDNFKIYSREFYNEFIDVEIEVTALMTGKKVKIRKSERGTRQDPSMESYYTL